MGGGGQFPMCCSCCRLTLQLPISWTFHYVHVGLQIRLTWEDLDSILKVMSMLWKEKGVTHLQLRWCFQFLLFCLWTVRLFPRRSLIFASFPVWVGEQEQQKGVDSLLSPAFRCLPDCSLPGVAAALGGVHVATIYPHSPLLTAACSITSAKVRGEEAVSCSFCDTGRGNF